MQLTMHDLSFRNSLQVALGHEEAEICLDADSAALGFKDGEINTQRGYGHPDLHARLDGCQNSSVRKPAHALIPADVKVGAVRISATGWEGWIIEGLKVILEPILKVGFQTPASRTWGRAGPCPKSGSRKPNTN